MKVKDLVKMPEGISENRYYQKGYNDACEKISNLPIDKEKLKEAIGIDNVPLINLLKECAHAIEIAITDEMGLDGDAGSILLIRINTLLQGYKKYEGD